MGKVREGGLGVEGNGIGCDGEAEDERRLLVLVYQHILHKYALFNKQITRLYNRYIHIYINIHMYVYGSITLLCGIH